MFSISDKRKAFVAAVAGLIDVGLVQLHVDPTLATAIMGVVGTFFVYRVTND